MQTTRLLSQALSVVLGASLLVAAPAARAELIGTEQITAQAQGDASAQIARDRQTLDHFMARQDVQREMQALGVDPQVAQQRLAALSNAEVEQLAGRVQSLPAAGAIGFQEMVIILLVAILVVLAL